MQKGCRMPYSTKKPSSSVWAMPDQILQSLFRSPDHGYTKGGVRLEVIHIEISCIELIYQELLQTFRESNLVGSTSICHKRLSHRRVFSRRFPMEDYTTGAHPKLSDVGSSTPSPLSSAS